MRLGGKLFAVLWAASTVSALPDFYNHAQDGEVEILVIDTPDYRDHDVQWRVTLEGIGDPIPQPPPQHPIPPPPPPPPHHPPPPPPPPPPPHHPHPPQPAPGYPSPVEQGKTILDFLAETPEFSRLYKFINFTGDIAVALNDTKSHVTLFAPNNKALQPPKHHHRRRKHINDVDLQELQEEITANPDAPENFALLEDLILEFERSDDSDNEKKKEWLKKLVRIILRYHTLPEKVTTDHLGKNTTFATSLNLHDGSLDNQPARLRVISFPKLAKPTYLINLYAKVLQHDIEATNGFVHVITHPLFPPPSIFDLLFWDTTGFSTFTSALQRVGLDVAVDWRYVPGDKGKTGTLEGSPSNSVFAPTNGAFKELPLKLKLFLFSPVGHHVLKKLLQFHIVPEYIFFTSWGHNATKSFTPSMGCDCDLTGLGLDQLDKYLPFDDEIEDQSYLLKRRSGRCLAMRPPIPPPHRRPHPQPVWALNVTLPSLLTNHSLPVHVAQFEHRSPLPPNKSSYYTLLIVNGQHVKLPDLPARNGAIHVIDKLLNPLRGHKKHRHGHHDGEDDGQFNDENEWDGWEDWLLKWADEN